MPKTANARLSEEKARELISEMPKDVPLILSSILSRKETQEALVSALLDITFKVTEEDKSIPQETIIRSLSTNLSLLALLPQILEAYYILFTDADISSADLLDKILKEPK